MGGCCCSSRGHHLTGTPVYYYCPSFLEEHESLTSNDSAMSSDEFFADLNLDMSTPDTYRSPPRPIPFDTILGNPKPGDDEKSVLDLIGSDFRGRKDGCFVSMEGLKSDVVNVKEEDIDCCPTCLEEYDEENPRIVAKCNHHFHLSCILEWMERSETCPICNKEMIYKTR